MGFDALAPALLASLRIAPALGFAPPFTLLRTPASVRIFIGVGLSLCILNAQPAQANLDLSEANLLPIALTELLAGISIALSLQLAFAAIQTAGRAIDFQVGFGLALLADPTLRTQTPLTGALLAYAGAAVFFATGGPTDFVRIWARSFERVPLGGFTHPDIGVLLEYISAVFVFAIALVGLALITLFLIDLAIAFLSRTLPQMNVLVLGFQVKTLAFLAIMPFVFAYSGAWFLRIVRLAIETAPRLV